MPAKLESDNQRATRNVRQRHSGDDAQNQQGGQQTGRPGIPFRTCPNCNTGDLCPRRPSSLKDWLAWLVMLKPFRCNHCSKRSYHR